MAGGGTDPVSWLAAIGQSGGQQAIQGHCWSHSMCLCSGKRKPGRNGSMCDSNFQPEATRIRRGEEAQLVGIPACVCCWRAIPIMWVRVDCAKTVRRNAPLEPHDGRVGVETLPTSLSVDACSRIYTRVGLIETAVLQP